jgi:two-component system phosphate regulon sensor histidine kinase PhoR
LIPRLSVKGISIAAITLLLCLACYEIFQLKDLYIQKKEQLDEDLTRTIKNVAFIHERENENRKLNDKLYKEFKTQYRKILENEFEGLLSGRQQVSIRDTTILVKNKEESYLVINGAASDSITGVSTQQITYIKDIRQLKDFVKKTNQMPNKSEKITVHLNQQLLQHIFKKAKFMNLLMLQAFKENVYKSPKDRVNVSEVDTLLITELTKAKLPEKYQFRILNERFEPLKMNTNCKRVVSGSMNPSIRTDLFPTDKFNEKMYIEVNFPFRNLFVLRQMKPYFFITGLFAILIIVTFYILIRTIRVQSEINTIKAAFISNMTHEFKTPISTISLACQALSDKDVVSSSTTDEISPYVSMITEENQRLSALVDGILQNSIGSSLSISLHYEFLDILKILQEQINIQKFKLNKEAKIDLKVIGTPIQIKADKIHTTNLLVNLIENAVKYSKGNPQIEISIIYNKEVKVIVKDYGIGMAKEHLARIFDRFYRVPTGNVHDVKGHGLGLSYVKSIAEAHGWKINVKSEEGVGSVFELIIDKVTNNENINSRR